MIFTKENNSIHWGKEIILRKKNFNNENERHCFHSTACCLFIFASFLYYLYNEESWQKKLEFIQGGN